MRRAALAIGLGVGAALTGAGTVRGGASFPAAAEVPIRVALAHLREADEAVRRDVLMVRSGMTRSFDPLVADGTALRAARTELGRALGGVVGLPDDPQVGAGLAALDRALADREPQVERLKTDLAVVHNATAYAVAAAPTLPRPLSDLAWAVASDADPAGIAGALGALDPVSAADPVVPHLRMAVERLPQVDAAVTAVTSPTVERDAIAVDAAIARARLGLAAQARRWDWVQLVGGVILAAVSCALGGSWLGAMADLRRELVVRASLERVAAEAARVARAADRAKTVFLANMSHELRTPLNAIIGYTELIREGGGDPAESAADLDRVVVAARHLLSLVDMVLDVARLESERLAYDLSDVDVDGLIAELEALCRPLVARRDNRLVVAAAPGLIARADRQRLKQILLNLVGNAAKFTARGEITLAVAVAGERVEFAVTDTGIGMSAEEQEHLFGLFVQVGAPHEGSGLGLHLSSRFAVGMGGGIAVRSAPGAGSTFTVWVPARASAG